MRFLTLSFLKMLLRWVFTVTSLRNSFSAMSLLLAPFATSVRISCSRVVKADMGFWAAEPGVRAQLDGFYPDKRLSGTYSLDSFCFLCTCL